VSVAAELAAWAVALEDRDSSPEVRHAASRHLLDGLGAAIAGSRTGAVDAAVTVADGMGGPPESTRLGSRRRLGAPSAVLANGTLVHALDFDDTHAGGLVHATAVVLPASFAVGEQVEATGSQVLSAAIVGYETVCRIAAASPHGFHARGLHATAIAGVFSSAIIASRLMGADVDTTTNALGIAGSSAGGLLEFLSTGASTKQLHAGFASMNGVIAARLAGAGASGPASVFEGPSGVYATLSARDADVRAVTRDLGSVWETTRITIKPYPSCQLMHVTLDAVSAARENANGPIEVSQVVEVSADVHPDSAHIVCEPVEVKTNPRTSYDAKFSLPWSVAALLIDGSIGIDTYQQRSIQRHDVAALAAKVKTHVTESDCVAADAPGRVVISFANGRSVVGEVPRSLGGPDLPLDDDALLAKFLLNAGGDTRPARELANRVMDLGAEESVTDIVELAARVTDGSH